MQRSRRRDGALEIGLWDPLWRELFLLFHDPAQLRRLRTYHPESWWSVPRPWALRTVLPGAAAIEDCSKDYPVIWATVRKTRNSPRSSRTS